MSPNKVVIYWVTLSFLFLIAGCNSSPDYSSNGERVPDNIRYNLHIRPILSDKCFACHGPDANKRQVGLRLDIAENAYKALDENPTAHALVPGDPMSSQVFLRISMEDPTRRMPPAESNLSLTAHEIKLIRKWIKQGSKYEPHWAFIAPEKPELPSVKDKKWVRNEIDNFTLLTD